MSLLLRVRRHARQRLLYAAVAARQQHRVPRRCLRLQPRQRVGEHQKGVQAVQRALRLLVIRELVVAVLVVVLAALQPEQPARLPPQRLDQRLVDLPAGGGERTGSTRSHMSQPPSRAPACTRRLRTSP